VIALGLVAIRFGEHRQGTIEAIAIAAVPASLAASPDQARARTTASRSM
jgi:hypothetical protein